MNLYRNKSGTVEAVRWIPRKTDPDAYDEIIGWLCDSKTDFAIRSPFDGAYMLIIPSREGDMVAQPGDWVLKTGDGVFIQCPPDIFEATYEKVEDGE
jgi:hypothetical protein